MTPTGETSRTAPAALGRDPAVAGLFRMSRTAGVGLQDYAEINVLAVTGLLLGALSFLAVVVPEALAILLIPAVAAVVSIIAFVQVQRSNGTQTGRWLAIGGLALALVFGGIHVAGYVRTASKESRWTAELNGLAGKLKLAATDQGAVEAYPLFDERFRQSVTQETFARQLQARMNVAKEVRVGDLVVYASDESGVTTAQTLLHVAGTATLPDGTTRDFAVDEPVEFRKGSAADPWQVHSIAGWFGATKPAAAPGTAGQPAAR